MDFIDQLRILGLGISVIEGFLITLLVSSLLARCGGRENCESRFCPIGLANDYFKYIAILICIILIVFIGFGYYISTFVII